jgi:transcriptional regulator with XRE-family HTH domain
MNGLTRREVRKRLGAKIRKLREARGLTINALSGSSDIPPVMIGQMENGRMRITLENLLCLSRALEVPLVELFDDGNAD